MSDELQGIGLAGLCFRLILLESGKKTSPVNRARGRLEVMIATQSLQGPALEQ